MKLALITNVLPDAEFQKVSKQLFELEYYQLELGLIGPHNDAAIPDNVMYSLNSEEVRAAIARQINYGPEYLVACQPRLWNVTMRSHGGYLLEHEDDNMGRQFACIYFAHPVWHYDWGGELVLPAHNITIPPIPNMMAVFSTEDTVHRVNEITSPIPRCAVTGWLARPQTYGVHCDEMDEEDLQNLAETRENYKVSPVLVDYKSNFEAFRAMRERGEL